MTDSELQNIIRGKIENIDLKNESGDWDAMEALLEQDQIKNPITWNKVFLITGTILLIGISLYLLLPSSKSIGNKTQRLSAENKSVNSEVNNIDTKEARKDEKSNTESHKKLENLPIKKTIPFNLKNERETVSRQIFSSLTINNKESDIGFESSKPSSLTIPIQREVELIVSIENKPDSAHRYISKIFDRNKSEWNNSVAVVDWTSSIYPFAGDILKWLEQHKNQQEIQGFVFFTDCDKYGVPTSESGLEGAMFTSRSNRSSEVKSIMLEALRNSLNNTDWKENDMEALLHAQEHFPDSKELILIADNSNSMKDYKELVHYIKKPVRIILCGNTEVAEKAIQPEYWKLAKITGGSVHLIDQDLYNVGGLRNGTVIRVNKYLYRYRYSNNFDLISSRKEYLERGFEYPFDN
ncbi:MAG: hypothetical protein AAF363_02325 [Bacteroidota bacterium]